jgi:hypothetical protein
MTDPLLRMLASLPQAEPDRGRAARVRTRCHIALARGRRPRAPRRSAGRRLRGTLLAGLGGLYLMETVRQALLLSGLV